MGDGWWVLLVTVFIARLKKLRPPENSSSPKASRGVKKRWSGIILKTLCWIQIKQKRKKKGRGKLESLINTAKRRLYLTYHQTSNITRQNHHMSKYDPSIRSIKRWLNRLKIVAWPQHFFIWTTGRMDHGNCWRCKNGVRSVLDDHDHDHGYPMKIPSVWIRELVPWLPFLILLDIACYGINQSTLSWMIWLSCTRVYRDGMCGKMKERMIALLVKGMIGGRSEVAREKEGGRAHYWNKSRSTNESINQQ